MSAKTPIRTVFNASNVATGLAEYQSGEFIPLSHGGIGAALSIGSAGQVLKVNSGASALEFGDVTAVFNIDGMTDGSSVSIAATDKFAISDGGTEKYVLASQIDTYISGTTQTLTNKTLTTPVIAEIDATGDFTVDAATDIILDADGGDIFVKDGGTTFGSLTNSSGDLVIKSGTTTAISMSGANVTVAGNLTVEGSTTTVDSTTISIQNAFVFEGATADAYETTLTTIDPTADRTISLPNVSGTLPVLAAASATQITSTPEELNLLDGVTATTAELNYVDGVTSNIQTQLDTKISSLTGATTAFAIAQAIALG
jgi:hypothetical protein